MPWNDLLSNQMVSFTDAQGGGFTLKAGQSNSPVDSSSKMYSEYVPNSLMERALNA